MNAQVQATGHLLRRTVTAKPIIVLFDMFQHLIMPTGRT
jgi:hypothetical protein